MNRGFFSGAALLAIVAPIAVHAQTADTIVAFDVAGGDLARTLDELARQSRTIIYYDADAVRGQTAPPVRVRAPLTEAVRIALGGSGLAIGATANGYVRVVSGGTDAAGDIVVTASRGSFTSIDSGTATRTDTPRRQTPGSIDVVTNDTLEARNATSFEDILKNVPGVTFAPTGAGVQGAVIRGDATTSTFQNGLGSVSNGTTPPIGGVDRIDVFKGPSALLNGVIAGVGTINYVNKTGSLTPVHSLTLIGGTNAFVQAVADIGGPLNEAGTIGFRVVGQSQFARTDEYGFRSVYERLITPKLRLKTNRTLIDLDFQYYEKRTGLQNFAYFDPAPANDGTGTIRRYGNQLDRSAGTRNTSTRYYASGEQTLVDSDGLQLKFRPRVAWEAGETELRSGGGYVRPGLFSDNPYYLLISNFVDRSVFSGYADFYAKFSTGPIEHQLIAGYDRRTVRQRQIGDSAVYPFFNAFPEVLPGTTVVPAPVPSAGKLSRLRVRQEGIIVQDQMNWGRLHAQISVRRSRYQNEGTSVFPASAVYDLPIEQQLADFRTPDSLLEEQPYASIDKSHWDPSGGLVFDVTKSIAVYGSYTSTFSPQLTGQATRVDGTPLDPEKRRQVEVGAKAGLFRERLQLTVSAYRYKTDGAAQTDPLNPSFNISADGLTGKGVEGSMTGSIDRRTNVIAGVTYGEFKQYVGPGFSVPALGTVDRDGVPSTTANLFVTRDIVAGPLAGLGFGIGGNYSSGFKFLYITEDNNQALGKLSRAFVSVDGSIRYNLGAIRLNLTVNNIFNRFNIYPGTLVNYDGFASQLGVAPGREAKLSARFDF